MQHCSEYSDSYSDVIYQTVDVDLPITLTPSVKIGNIKIASCGEPQVELCRVGCCGALELNVTQTIAYKIPIEYRIESSTGDLMTDCGQCGAHEKCTQYRPCSHSAKG